jgi:hypothetical protein
VRGCATCQKNKTEHVHPAGLLQPLGVSSAIWADISMDFMKGFPKINSKMVILTMVDLFSKAAHFITLGHPYTATTVARAFFTEIVRLHGIPSSIVYQQLLAGIIQAVRCTPPDVVDLPPSV